MLDVLRFVILWPALVILILDQLVVNRSTASVVGLFAFLPDGARETLTSFVTMLQAHSDFWSFLGFIAIYLAAVALIGASRRFYAHWRHAVSDSALRALPILLVGIDDTEK